MSNRYLHQQGLLVGVPGVVGYRVGVKKLLLVVLLAGIGYIVYRQVMAARAEQDLWSEATSEPDLR